MGTLKSINIVNLHRIMTMFKLTINVNRLCCVFSFLRLKMANLSDLVGFASTVTHAKPGAKRKTHQLAQN